MSQQNIVLSPMQWAKLENIDAIPELNDSDAQCLGEIGEVLRKHNMTERFGVNLLHKHFDIGENETLMESTDKENRRLIIETVSSEHTERSVQTNWMFVDEGGGHATMWCTQRCGKNIWGQHTDAGHDRT